MKKLKVDYVISYEEEIEVPDDWEDDDNFDIEDYINSSYATQTDFFIESIEILEDNKYVD
jgi:hypothetical protein